jgi:prepilin-type N-terminal cleavage/methylation domain-containing protein
MFCLRPHSAISRAAFTLIELLTVIAIIGILASLVIATVGRVRETARRATCASNLRQAGSVLMLYAQDNRGLLPGPLFSVIGPYPDANPNAKLLVSFVHPYLTGMNNLNGNRPKIGIFECPTWATAIPEVEQINGNCYVLGYDYELTPGTFVRPFGEAPNRTQPLALSRIQNPSRVLAIGDLDARDRTPYLGVAGVAQTPLHGSIRNSLFFDGSVRTQAVR